MFAVNPSRSSSGDSKPTVGLPKSSSTSASPSPPTKSTTYVPQASGLLSKRSAPPAAVAPPSKNTTMGGASISAPPEKLTILLHYKNSEKYAPFLLAAILEEDRKEIEGYTLDSCIHYAMSHFGKTFTTMIVVANKALASQDFSLQDRISELKKDLAVVKKKLKEKYATIFKSKEAYSK